MGYETYGYKPPTAAEMMGYNRPMWQTSQQGWAKQERDENAARILRESQNNPRAFTRGAEARQQIAQQGGGMGMASNIGGGPGPSKRDWEFVNSVLAEEAFMDRLQREVQKRGLQEQLATYDFNAEQRAASRDMLRNARNNMRGATTTTGGSYRV